MIASCRQRENLATFERDAAEGEGEGEGHILQVYLNVPKKLTTSIHRRRLSSLRSPATVSAAR